MDSQESLEKLLHIKPALTLDTEAIKLLLPHRNPFLLVDTVDIIEEGKHCVGTRFVSPDDPVFKGHFPGYPIYPAVLIIEALSQAGAALLMRMEMYKSKIGFTMGIETARFRKPVRPGDTVRLAMEVLRAGSRAGRMRGEAYVNGELHAEGTVSFIIADKKTIFPKEG